MLRSDIRSLTTLTDIDMLWTGGRVIERDTHIVVCEPNNPGHYWGNFIVFPRAPEGPESRDEWEALFRREFGPEYKHFAFTWNTVDGELGDISSFEANGYRVEKTVALIAEPGDIVQPPKFNTEVEVRALDPDDTDAWYDVIDFWVDGREDGHTEASYRAYAGRAARHRRSLVRAGLGVWNGAFIGDKLVGSMGVFVFEGRGRFQAVDTHPDHRRQGICGRLVYETATAAFEQFGATELVMLADEEYHAALIYESCGFTPTQHTPSVEWWPGSAG